eukprot:16446903-Heterocapsa_arctica.AAC.1
MSGQPTGGELEPNGTQMGDPQRSREDLDVSHSNGCPCTTCAAQRRARATVENEADDSLESECEESSSPTDDDREPDVLPSFGDPVNGPWARCPCCCWGGPAPSRADG